MARLALMFLPTLLLLSVVEFVIASLGVAPQQKPAILIWASERDHGFEDRDSVFRFHPKWMWEPRPGATEFGSTINQGGYRGDYYPKAKRPGATRICTLGDSSTYGFPMRESMAWSRVLESLFRKVGAEVDVLNFGCTGYSLMQGWKLYLGRVRDYHPDVVILAFGAVNDRFPPTGGLIDSEKMKVISTPAYLLRRFLSRYDTFRYIEHLFRTEKVDLNGKTPSETLRVPVAEFEQTLRDFARQVKADGAKLVIVSPPRRRDLEVIAPVTLEYTAALSKVAAELDIPFADVRFQFRKSEETEMGDRVNDPSVYKSSRLFVDTVHPSDVGHRLYATVVGKIIYDSGLVPMGELPFEVPDLPR